MMLLGHVLQWNKESQRGVVQDYNGNKYILLGKNTVKWARAVIRTGRSVGFESSTVAGQPVALGVFIVASGGGSGDTTFLELE